MTLTGIGCGQEAKRTLPVHGHCSGLVASSLLCSLGSFARSQNALQSRLQQGLGVRLELGQQVVTALAAPSGCSVRTRLHTLGLSESRTAVRRAGCGSLSHTVCRFWPLPRMRASRVLTGFVPVSGRPSSVQSCPFGSCVTCVSDSLSTDLNIRFPRGCMVTEAEQNL